MGRHFIKRRFIIENQKGHYLRGFDNGNMLFTQSKLKALKYGEESARQQAAYPGLFIKGLPLLVEAKEMAQLRGDKYFQLFIKCPKCHTDRRYTSSGGCVQCNLNRAKARRKPGLRKVPTVLGHKQAALLLPILENSLMEQNLSTEESMFVDELIDRIKVNQGLNNDFDKQTQQQ